jgi:RNA 2',3'-cyclic 3'-phosphodiesterase
VVAKQRLKSPRARLFVALELPERVRDGLAAWQRAELEPLPMLRPARPEALHVTLAFLGHHPEKRIPRLAEVIERMEGGAPTLRFLPEPVPVPKGRPRLFAAQAESEATISLQARLEEALVAERLYEPEKRPFWPHVTLARVRPERRGSRKPARVDVPPRALPEDVLEPFESVRLTAYRSYLRPQGAEYVPLASIDLKVS